MNAHHLMLDLPYFQSLNLSKFSWWEYIFSYFKNNLVSSTLSWKSTLMRFMEVTQGEKNIWSLENQDERNKGWENRIQACVTYEKSWIPHKWNRTTT